MFCAPTHGYADPRAVPEQNATLKFHLESQRPFSKDYGLFWSVACCFAVVGFPGSLMFLEALAAQADVLNAAVEGLRTA